VPIGRELPAGGISCILGAMNISAAARMRDMVGRLAQPFVAAGLIAATFQLLAGLPIGNAQVPTGFLSEHVIEFALADTSWQRLVYQLVLAAALWLTVLTYLVRPPRPSAAGGRRLSRLSANLLFLTLILFGVIALNKGVVTAMLSAAAGLVVLSAWLLLARLRPSRAGLLRAGLAMVCLALLALFVLPGFDRPIALRSIENVTTVSVHYAGSFGPAMKLALGTPIDHIRLNYGIFPLLAALFPAVDRHGFDGLYDVVLAGQLLFLAGLMVCAFVYDRSKGLFLPSFMLILVVPFVSTYYRSMYYPNQSGARYLGFLAMLLLLRWGRAGLAAGFWLGLAGAASIFYNPETGIAICLGLAFRQIAVGLSDRRIAGAVLYGCAFVLGLTAGLVGLAGLAFGLVGINPAVISSYITDFSGGYAGIHFRPEPCSFLMMLCGIALMAQAAARAAGERLTTAQARRTAIGVTMLVWLAYYVNRADPWNLWSLVLLLLFAASDWIGLRRWRASVGWLQRGRLTLATAAVIGVAVPFAVQNAIDTAGALFQTWPTATAEFSGALMPESMQAELSAKTAALRGLAIGGNLVYVTIDPTFVALGSGIDSGLAGGDVFSDTLRLSDIQHLREEILRRAPDLLLFDSPDGVATRAFPQRVRFLLRLQADLSDAYAADRSESGWDIWRRRNSP